MRCRRICRELLWLARFGEFGPSSQPHLDHLAGCAGCRDEVGYDREMVRQLRAALAARIEGMQPSPSAWEGILRRAQAPEPSRFAAWWSRSLGLVGRLRTATAMAGTGLALVLALNMEVMPPVAAPATDGGAEAEAASLQTVPRTPTGRTALVALLRQDASNATARRPDPESVMTLIGARASIRPIAEPVADGPESGVRVTFRAPQVLDPGQPQVAALEPAPPAGSPQQQPGEPS
jgi:hypothetical protein